MGWFLVGEPSVLKNEASYLKSSLRWGVRAKCKKKKGYRRIFFYGECVKTGLLPLLTVVETVIRSIIDFRELNCHITQHNGCIGRLFCYGQDVTQGQFLSNTAGFEFSFLSRLTYMHFSAEDNKKKNKNK